jgi:hypothetical protein
MNGFAVAHVERSECRHVVNLAIPVIRAQSMRCRTEMPVLALTSGVTFGKEPQMPNKDTATRNHKPSELSRVRRAPAPGTAHSQRGPVSMRQLIQRALDDPSSLTAVDGAHLQRSIGNRAVGQILAASAAAKRAANPGAPVVQTKLTLGPAGDKYEQEADRTAKQVMRSLDASAPAAQTDAAPNETLRRQTIRHVAGRAAGQRHGASRA